ncbi:MAG: hypothetical protein JXB34_05960 [Bacteroidales bacterium]|nr:hypothetical protein [Bacteroidales bacterium]
MEKRFVISGVILAICIVAITGFFVLRSRDHSGTEPLKTIPQNAFMVIRFNGFETPFAITDTNSQVWSSLESLGIVSSINSQLRFIGSVLNKNPKFYKPQPGDKIYISGHLVSVNNIGFLSIMPVPMAINEREIIKLLKSFGFPVNTRKYENKTVFSISRPQGAEHHLALIGGYVLYSPYAELIEDAIRQSSLAASLTDNPGFNMLLSTIGKNKEANIFIDLKQTGKLFALAANENFKERSKKYMSLGDWIELDFTSKTDLFMFNGFSYLSDSATSFLKLISSQQPVNIACPQVLPSSVNAFISFGFTDPVAYYAYYCEYLKGISKFDSYKANLENMNKKYGISFEKTFLSLISDGITLAHSGSEYPKKSSYYLILNVKSGTETEKSIKELCRKLEDYISKPLNYSYRPDSETSREIYKIPVYPLFGRLIGDFFNRFDENYLTVIENYLVVAGSFDDATHIIDSYIRQKTLSTDETFRNANQSVTPKAYLHAYCNLARSQNVFSEYFNNEIISKCEDNKTAFEKVQVASLQLSEVSQKPYLNLFFKHISNFRDKPHTVWETLLDTVTGFKPKFLLNHNTRQNEIFVQDRENNIYLISQSGRILWKLPFSEIINSDIYQVDYYKNGKLQMMFSTENYLHLIDRNGNYLENYPVRLRSKASGGMSLFDYEGDRNYRIFVPCADKKVYAYSKEGSLINGWNYKGSDYEVLQPLCHFAHKNKDYIVFGDFNYTYIVDRKGDQRIAPSETFPKSKNNSYFFSESETSPGPFFVTTDTSGNICKILLNGQVTKQTIKRFSPNHFFDFKDVDADGKPDYIFFDNNTLEVYKQNSELLFSRNFESNIGQRPVYYYFSFNDRKIGLVSDEKKLIYLVNSNGALYKGFPLEGSTHFTIGHFDPASPRFNLVVGGRNNFLYNYAVE